ncbi:MAG: PKD domain-containing protein [Bacteroidetes bacterium]|nr:PKD domain-containing protein [Bacteroidota bacterium]MBU1719054.1 PKD domain-containing protein [Bacteroidota bacterium]
MRIIRYFMLATAICALYTTAFTANYYVAPSGSDSNAGTSSSAPFLTITKATSYAMAGDTVFVAPGTYAETVILLNGGVSESNRLVFFADTAALHFGGGAGEVILDASGQTNGFEVKNLSFVSIVGFTVNNAGYEGIYLRSTSGGANVNGCTVEANKVNNWGASTSGIAGISVYTTAGYSATGTKILNNILTATTTGDIGVYVDAFQAGDEADSTFIIGNHIHALMSGVQLSKWTRYTRIRNNVISGFFMNGIWMDHDNTFATIANNVLFSGSGTAIGVKILSFNNNNNSYVNNTIKTPGRCIEIGSSTNLNTTILNNILFTTSSVAMDACVIVASGSTLETCNFNTYYQPNGARIMQVNGVYYSDLALLQGTTHSNSGDDSRSLVQNPLFVSTSDLRLQPYSECNNSGTHSPTSPVDIIGTSRHSWHPSVGAFEIIRVPLAGNYTLGSGQNFSTFAEAATALYTHGISAPVVIQPIPGVYSDKPVFRKIDGTNSSYKVQIYNSLYDSTTIVLTSNPTTSTANYSLKIDSCDYIEFHGISLSTSGTTYSRLLEMRFPKGVVFENCNFNGQVVTVTSFDNNLVSISSDKGENAFMNSNFYNGSNGIDWMGQGFSNDKIIGCNFDNQYSQGIFSYSNPGIEINSNSIRSLNAASTYEAIRIESTTGVMKILNNQILVNNGAVGIQLMSSSGTPSFHEIVNNSLKMTGATPCIGVKLNTSNYVTIYFNTIDIESGIASAKCVDILNSDNNAVRNNILINPGGGYVMNISNLTNFTSNHNCFFTAGSTLVMDGANPYSTLGNWQASSFDLNSLFHLPVFIAPDDFHVNDTLLDNKGIYISGFMYDIDGQNRSVSMPDIGADEFVGIQLAPDTTLCAGNVFTVDAGTGYSSYLWGPGNETSSSISVSTTGNYSIEVTDANGIAGVDTIHVAFLSPTVLIQEPDTAICEGSSIALNVSGANTYMWSPTIGLSSTTAFNPVASPPASITYTVSGTDIQGCTGSDTIAITIIALPQISFTGDPVICRGDTADISVSGAVSYSWMPSGSVSGTAPDYRLCPMTNLDYKLTGIDASGCSDYIMLTIYVNQPVTPKFIYTINSTTANFQNLSPLADKIMWSFGDGYFSGQKNPVHDYVTSDVYHACMTVIDSTDHCRPATLCKNIDLGVTAPCDADFNSTGTQSGLPVIFNNNSTGSNLRMFWNFGDGFFSNANNTTHTYNVSGIFNVTLNILDTASGCFSSFTDKVIIDSVAGSCRADFTWEIDSTTNTIQFINTSAGLPNNFFWRFGDGTTSNLKNPSHTFPAQGYFEVILVASKPATGCLDEETKLVSVHHNPMDCEADFQYSIALGENKAIFQNQSMGIPGAMYHWDFGDGDTSTIKNPVHIYSDWGTYNTCLRIKNPATGLSNIKCKDVHVGDDSAHCFAKFTQMSTFDNLTVRFFDLSPGNPDLREWDFGDGTTSTLQNPVKTYSSAGFYMVHLRVRNTITGCLADFVDMVDAGDTTAGLQASFGYSIDTTFNKSNQYPADFKGAAFGDPAVISWDFGDGSMDSTTMSPTHVYQSTGAFPVCFGVSDPLLGYTDEYCEDVQIDSAQVGIPITFDLPQLKIFPNPATDVLYLGIKAVESGNLDISISDISGRVMTNTTERINAGNNVVTMSLDGLGTGVYILQISTTRSHFTRRFEVLR